MKHQIFIFLFSLSTSFIFCGEEIYIEYLTPTQVSNHEGFDYQDGHYQEMEVSGWQNSFQNASVKNKIWIGYVKGAYPMGNENPQVELFIEYWTHDGTNFVYVVTIAPYGYQHYDYVTVIYQGMVNMLMFLLKEL